MNRGWNLRSKKSAGARIGSAHTRTTRRTMPLEPEHTEEHTRTDACRQLFICALAHLLPNTHTVCSAPKCPPVSPLSHSVSEEAGIQSFTAFVRCSNGPFQTSNEWTHGGWLLSPDATPDIRGMAVKVVWPLSRTGNASTMLRKWLCMAPEEFSWKAFLIGVGKISVVLARGLLSIPHMNLQGGKVMNAPFGLLRCAFSYGQ